MEGFNPRESIKKGVVAAGLVASTLEGATAGIANDMLPHSENKNGKLLVEVNEKTPEEKIMDHIMALESSLRAKAEQISVHEKPVIAITTKSSFENTVSFPDGSLPEDFMADEIRAGLVNNQETLSVVDRSDHGQYVIDEEFKLRGEVKKEGVQNGVGNLVRGYVLPDFYVIVEKEMVEGDSYVVRARVMDVKGKKQVDEWRTRFLANNTDEGVEQETKEFSDEVLTRIGNLQITKN